MTADPDFDPGFDVDAAEAPTAPHRTLVWADPEPGHHAWWAATRLVYLPGGVSFADLPATGPVEVTVSCDVAPLASGLNELTLRYDAAWSTHHPETTTVDRHLLLRPYDDAETGHFRTERDRYRLTHHLPRAVVRSDVHDPTTGTRLAHHQLRHPWPAGVFTQGGQAHTGRPATPEDHADPNVFVGQNGYAILDDGYFLEAVPTHPATLLRGEGPTFAAAEDAAWAQWTRITGCPSPTGDHVYETRGYRNGCGICAHCGLFATDVFDLAEIGSTCVVCGTGTWWCHVPGRDQDGRLDPSTEDLVCREHAPPDYYTVTDALRDHARGRGPAPDTTWFAGHLPAGVTAADADPAVLRDAVEQGRRDLLDQLLAAARDAEPR